MRTRPRRNSNTPDQEAARIFEAKLKRHVQENPECQWEFDWYRNTLKKSIRRSRVLIDEQVKKKAESDQPLCNKFMLELAKPHSYLDEAEAVPTSEPSRPVESISKSSVPEIIFMPDMDTATPRFERPSPFDHVRTDADATRGDATQIAGRTDSTRKVDDKAREIPRTNYTTRDIPRTTTPHTSYQAGDHPIVLDSVEIGSLRGDAGDLSPSIGERNAPDQVQVERAQESKPVEVPVFQIPPTPKGPYKLPGTFQESLTSVDDLTVHIPSKQTEDEARTPTGERESPDLVSPRDDEVLVPGPVAARETTPAPVSRGPYKLPGTYHASVQSLATLDGSGEDLTVQIPKEPEVASADEAQTPTEPVAGKEKEQPTIEPEVVPKQVEQEAPSGGLGLQGVSTEPKSQVIPAESKPPVGFVEPESSALPSQPELPVASSELEPAAVLGEPEAALPVDNSTTQPVVEELPKDAPAEPAQPVSATAPASASTSRGPYKLPGAFQTSVQSLVTHDGSGEDLTTQVSKKPEVVVEDAAESTEPAAEEKQPIVSSQPEPKAASSDLPKPQVASSEPEEQFESSEPKTEPTSEPEPSSLPVAPTIDDSTAQVSIEPTTEKQKDVELEQPVAPSQAEPEVGPNEPESQAESSQPDREVEPSQPAPMAESSVLVPATTPGVSVDDSPAQVSKDTSKAQAKPAASAEPIDQAVSDEPKTVPDASSEPVQDLDDSLLLDSVLDLDHFPKPPPTLHVPVTQPSLDSQKSPISPIVPGAYPRNIFGITPVLSTKPLEGASPNPVSEPLPPAPPSDELDQNVSAPAPAGRVPLPTGPLELNTSQDVLKPVLESGTPSFKYLSGLTPYDIRSRGVNDEREDDVEELADVEPVSEPVLAVPGLEAVLESKEEAPEPVEAVDEPEALSHGVETIPEPVVAKEPVEDAPEPAENVPEPVGPVDEPVEAVPKSAELVPEAVEATPQPVETAHEPVLEPEALDEPSVDAPKPSEAQDEASSLSESENVPAVAEETREPTEEVKSNSEVATGPVEVATELAEVAPEPTVATPEPLGRVEEPVKAVPGSVEAISGGVEATPGRAEVVPEPEAKPEIQDERSNVDAAPQPDEPSRDVVDLPSKTLSTLAAAEKTEEPIEDNGPPENVPPPAVTEPDTVVPPVTAEPAKASESAREEEPVKTSTETPAVQVDSTPGTNAPSKIEEVKDLQTHDKPNSAVTEPQAELPPATAQESTPATPVSQPQHVDEPQREAEAPQVKLEATPTQEPVIQPEEHLQTQPKDEPVVPSLDPTPAVQQSVEAQPEADHDSKAEPAVPPVETPETQAPVISQADPIVAKESEPAPTESKTEPLPAAETLATIKPVRHADEPRGETETPQVELETAPNQQLANQTKEMHPQTLPKDEPEPEQASAESKAEPLSTLEPSPAAELEEPQLGQTSTSGNLAIPPSAPVVAAVATPSPQVPQTIPSANIAPASKPRFVVAPVAPVVEPSLVPQGLPPPLEPSSEVADESKPAAVAPSEPIPRISNSTPLPEPNPDVKLDVPEPTEPAKLKAVINSLGDDIPEIIDNGPEEAPIVQPAANVHAPKGVEAAPESIKEVEEARLDEVSEQTESKDEPRSPSFEPVVVAPVVQQLVETRSKLAHDTKAEQALAIPQAETVVLESEPEPVKEVEQAAPEPKIAPLPVVELDQSEPEPSQAPTLDNLPALSVATPVSQVSQRDPSANTTPIPESQSTTSEVAQAIPETQALPAPVIESLSHVVEEAKPVVVEHSGTLPAILDSVQLPEPEPDVKLAAPTEEPAEPGASVEHVLPKVESIVDNDQEATSDVQPAAEGVRIHAPKTVESLPQTKAEQTQPELVLETPQPTTQSAPEPETATPKDIREEKAVNTRITEPQLVAGPTSKPSSQAPEIPQIPGKPVAISIAQLSGPSAPATPEAPVQQIQVQPHLNTPAKSAEVLPVAQPKDRPVPSAERDVIPGQPVDSQLPRETEVDQPEAPEHRPSSELLQLTPKAANLHETDPKPDAVLDVPNPVPIKASIVNPPASQTADVVQETLHRPEPAEIVQPVPETKSQPPPQSPTPPDEPESRLDPKVNDLRKEADKFAQQFSAYGDIDDLDNAIQKYGEAAELLAPDSETLDVSSYLNLGRMMRVKFEAFYDIEDLKSAVNDALLKAHASLEAKPTDPTYYDVLHELGAAFLDRYLYYGFETAEDKADFEDSGDEADLETAGNKAEEYCQLALNASSTPSGSKVAATHIVLSRIHLTRFEYLSTAGDAIEALRSLGRAADADRNLANDARYQEYRARALYACYQTGQPEYGGYLDQAFNFAVRARNQTPNTTVQFPIVSTFLAELLLARYERSNNRADLDEALRLLEDAVQEVPYICPEQPWIGECLARGLVARYVNDGDRDDLEDAISFLDIAVNLTVKNTYRRRARLNTLGGALTLRFRHLALGDGSGRARELMAGIGSM
ncbi:hypothetical protein FRC07_015169 [Ceratobasidium sp. 392]|nr:hypothetical protein FRC07_015169 [Ceratobasidium sp. 392]